MGKEDVHESDYLENTEIFADLIKGVLYQGEQVVKPEELVEQDGELRSILGEHTKKMIRDKVKLWNGTALAVFAVENQTKVDYHMVLRAMLTESMAYDRQWKKLRAKYKRPEGKVPLTPEEFLSGMRKGDKFIPVITIVIYYGREKPWDGAKTLYELLVVKESAEKILPFVSDYKLNVFDYHEHKDFGQFHSELRSVFEFLRYCDNRELLAKKLEQEKERYGRLSPQAKVLLTKITNIKKIPDITKEDFEKGEFDMCKAFEDMEKKGRIEGRLEGEQKGRAREIVELGREFGLSESKILEKLQGKLNLSRENAAQYFAMFAGEAV